MATDYDKGKITDRERKAAQNQTTISQENVNDVKNQLSRQLANYDFADAQNRALANTQLAQNSRKTSADRFEAQRDLQAATLGLLGSMGSAMNGSTTGNLMSMLRSRNDKENNTYWAQHQENQDQVENAYNDSLNQNNVARRDAMQSAEKAIRDITADWRANMNNINPNLFPGADKSITGSTAASTAAGAINSLFGGGKTVGGGVSVGNSPKLNAGTVWTPGAVRQNTSDISGYVIPDNRGVESLPTGQTNPRQSMNVGAVRNQVRGGAGNVVGGDYFSQMMNRFNGMTPSSSNNAAANKAEDRANMTRLTPNANRAKTQQAMSEARSNQEVVKNMNNMARQAMLNSSNR